MLGLGVFPAGTLVRELGPQEPCDVADKTKQKQSKFLKDQNDLSSL